MPEQIDGKRNAGGVNWTAVIPLAVFLTLLGVGCYFLVSNQLENKRRQGLMVARQQQNEELGLPRDYPLDVVPIYTGVEITEAERGSAIADTGEPMDMWHVHGQIDEAKEPIFEFYNKLLIDYGMRQLQFVGLPTGYGIDYGDEIHSISLVIEKTLVDELMQLDIKVYRVREN